MAKAFYIIFFLIYESYSQKFGLNSLGPLPYERLGLCNEIPTCGLSVSPQLCQSTCNQPSPIINLSQPTLSSVPTCAPIPPCQIQQFGSCQQIIPSCQNINIPVPQIISSPSLPCSVPSINPCNAVATTIVDNTLANSLANAIQLLIVSNLIENTLNTNCGGYSYNPISNYDVPCLTNVIDLTSPDFFGVCDPFDTYFEVPCIPEPVVNYQVPCVEINSVSPCLSNSFNLVNDCGCSGVPIGCSNVPISCSNVPIGCSNVPIGCSNVPIGCSSAPIGCSNVPMSCSTMPIGCSNVPMSCSNVPIGCSNVPMGCIDGAIGTFAPVTAEVLFPSAIPAQLTCNFGYMNTNVPCVSVNVEPLAFPNGVFY